MSLDRWEPTPSMAEPAPSISELRRTIDRLERELAEARAENTRVRAALAQSDRPCAYCSLPADEWAKCKSGFPGCARADDAMGCPELGASLERDNLRAQLEHLKKANSNSD